MKGAVLDIDGVLMRGSEVIEGAPEALYGMLEAGVGIVYLTNNSTRTREEVRSSLTAKGFPDAPVITSAFAASAYILEKYGRSRCLAVGESGLMEELGSSGHIAISAGEGRGAGPLKAAKWSVSEPSVFGALLVDCVVVGLDRSVTYSRIADALFSIRKGAEFIATNEDPTLPVEGGDVFPGAGSVVSAVRTCSGVTPVVVGKPEVYSTSLALRALDLEPSDVLMIGDRADTDMAAASASGCRGAMVLTGDQKAPRKHHGFDVYDDITSIADDLFQ